MAHSTHRPLAIIQSIATRWTKISRGGDGATRRNAVPEVLDLPEYELQCGPELVAWHDVRFSEPSFSGIATPRLVGLPMVRVPRLDLVHVSPSSLRLDLLGKPCVELAPGDTAAVIYNFLEVESHLDCRVDVYRKLSVHVAFALAPDRLLFRRPPRETRRLMDDLP